ncbi:hypothetical protein TheetDRAFT_3374, partial [Thermoanaerobacter ethanolicus JW 200]
KSKYEVKIEARQQALKNGLHGKDVFNAMNNSVFNAGIFLYKHMQLTERKLKSSQTGANPKG